MENPTQNIFDVMESRRSIRQYRREPMDPAVLQRIASTGALAPSAGNGQPCRFLVIDDREKIHALLDASLDAQFPNPEDAEARQRSKNWSDRYRDASAVILVLQDMQSPWPDYAAHDCPLAAENILLAAAALGYGTTYLTDTINQDGEKKALNLPERYVPYCAIVVGVPAALPEKPEKKKLSEVVWRNAVEQPFD